jgi:hypothetical protein
MRERSAVPQRYMIPAQFRPALEMAMDMLLVDCVRPVYPAFALAECRPGEQLEIVVRVVMPSGAQ